jgi:hypothetical protein
MELDLMAPSPHAQVALLFCSGIISLIWFRRAERVGLLENTFLVISRLSVFFAFFLFYFWICAVYQCILMSGLSQLSHVIATSISFHRLGNLWERPSPVIARLSVLLLDPFHHGEWSRWHRHLQSGRENP